MVESIVGFILVLLGLFALALQRFYSSVPAKELKRLAARGDHMAAGLYRPVAYGASMRLLLWIIFAVSIAGGLLLLLHSLSTWATFGAIVLTLAVIVWLQSIRLSVRSARLAVTAAPALHGLLGYVHPPFHFLTRTVNRYRQHLPHSGLYEKEDLLALLGQQRAQLDNRIAPAELELVERVLTLNDVQAADVVLPWSQVKLVNVQEHIGPVLLGELHDSGQDSFLVYDGKPDNIVGTLFLRDAVHAKNGGKVSTLLHPKVCFVHEDFSLRKVLDAFAETGQFMVVVVNKFEEAVGVITLKHLLAQVVGQAEQEDFSYESRASIASFVPRLQPAEEPVVDEIPDQPLPEQTEVVESKEGEP